MNWKLTNSMMKGSKLWSKQYLNSIAFRCSSSYSKNNSGFNPVLQNSFIDSTNSKDTDPWLNETWKTKRKLDRTQHESKLLRHRAREPDLNAFRQALQRKDRVLAWLKFKDISITVQSKQLTRADYLDLLHLLLSQDKRKPSIPTINHVINTMKTMDISIDIDVYNILVKSYAYSNQEEQISNTLRKMKELGISPNLETYSIIIYMYLKSQSIEKALAFIDRMKQENIPYNTSTYNTIIAGLINCGQLDLAQSFYKEMKENGFENNSGTFIQLIRLSIKLDDLPTAERIFEESIELGLVNKYTCSAILSFYAKLGDEVKIDGVLEYMKKNSIELDSLIYQSVIQSKLANKNIDGAFEIIEKMKMENIYPDFVTVHTILHGIVETGDLDRAIAYLEEQKGQGKYHTIVDDQGVKYHFKCILHCLLDCQNNYEPKNCFMCLIQ
ncbi:hypothetical protein BC833DRAFT_571496 [Globomyces pollinis-pini]|nr:hypothetical protein BC833DRAFT_571496 [Globomyces pollinis-pini]